MQATKSTDQQGEGVRQKHWQARHDADTPSASEEDERLNAGGISMNEAAEELIAERLGWGHTAWQRTARIIGTRW